MRSLRVRALELLGVPEGELEGSVAGLDLATGHGWTWPRSPRRCAKPTWTSATLEAPGSLLSAPPHRLQDAGLQGAPILAFQSPQEPPPEPAAARKRREEEDAAERRASFTAPNKPRSVRGATLVGSQKRRQCWLQRLQLHQPAQLAEGGACQRPDSLSPARATGSRRFLLGWETGSTWGVRAQGVPLPSCPSSPRC